MQRIKIEDLWVQFPYVPYGPQEEFMKKMVMSLRMGKNALLESPTGTGKTVCLLCGSLAWLDLQKKLEEIPELRSDYLGDETMMEEAGRAHHYDRIRYKIYFCSKTHSQIQQAIQEFQNSAYGHIRASVMGSRNHLCINPVALKAGSNLDAKCRALRTETDCRDPGPDIEDLPKKCSTCEDDHTCPFYKNFQSMVSEGKEYLFKEGGALNQMGLKNKCRKYKVCPFYMSRHLQKKADIVFLPYSYIFNPHILKGLRLDLQNSVIIVDEGHNLEQVCEDNASFSIKASDFLKAKEELHNVIEMRRLLQNNRGNFPPRILRKRSRLLELRERSILEISEISLKLANAFKTEIQPGDNDYTGADCIKYFNDAGLTYATKDVILYNLKEIIQACGQSDMKTEGMKKLNEVCSCVFYLDEETRQTNGETDTHLSTLRENFVLYKEKEPTGPGSEEKKKNFEPRIFFWCFDAGVIMNSLKNAGVHSFIVTSGTLSPLEPLRKSLSIPFEVELVNDHVIDSSQVLGMCLPTSQSIDGNVEDLLFSYDYREEYGDRLYEALGHAVFRIASVSPKGLLIFFPSAKVKKDCLTRWEEVKVLNDNNVEVSLYEAIATFKPIFEEPSVTMELHDLQRRYNEKNYEEGSNGACLIGVMSGKVSEGIDFKDDLGRVVIMIGLQYLPPFDPKVIKKRKHLIRKGGMGSDAAWYLASAIRPVNQALGRIIRHQKDYGVVVMADKRFNKPSDVTRQLPTWLKKRAGCGPLSLEAVPFQDLQDRLKRFFSAIPGKMQELSVLAEQKQLQILQRHNEQRKREETIETDYLGLLHKRDEERQREKKLKHDINRLQAILQEKNRVISDLQNKLTLKEKSNANGAHEQCPSSYDSDCDSTGDADWDAIEPSK